MALLVPRERDDHRRCAAKYGAVWDEYCAGNLKGIRDYCETDVLNTWLVYLRFEHLRGTLGETALAAEFARVREFLQTSDAAHLQAFLAAWDAAGAA